MKIRFQGRWAFVLVALFWASASLAQLVGIEALEGLPNALQVFLYEEQVLHNKNLWPANSFDSDIDPKYNPENRPVFGLAYYLVPTELGILLESPELSDEVLEQITVQKNGKSYYKLFVHPESEAHYEFLKARCEYISSEASEFYASPTSSYRSLLVWNKNDQSRVSFIAKVSLDRDIIGSIDRLVSKREVIRSVTNQRFVSRLGEAHWKASHMRFFPETAGLTLNIENGFKKIGGQLIREIPIEVRQGVRRWISFSALMSPNRKDGIPLIVDVLQKSGLTPEKFVRTFLIQGYLEMCKRVSIETGLNIEPHSQNLLFETTQNLVPTGNWVYRDFGGMFPDLLTMLENAIDIRDYQIENNASHLKLLEGRTDIINSFLFFYRRQVFDMTLAELQKFYPRELNNRIVRSLRSELNSSWMNLIESHFKTRLFNSEPTLNEQASLVKKAKNSAKYSLDSSWKELPTKSLPSTMAALLPWNKSVYEEARKELSRRIDARDWVDFTGVPSYKKVKTYANARFYSKGAITIATDKDRVLGFSLSSEKAAPEAPLCLSFLKAAAGF